MGNSVDNNNLENVIDFKEYKNKKELKEINDIHDDLKNIFYQVTGNHLSPDLKISGHSIENSYSKEENILEAIKFLEFAQFHLFNIDCQSDADSLNSLIERLYTQIDLGIVDE